MDPFVCVKTSAVLEVSGHVDGEVSIHCSVSWTKDNSSEHSNMYFCKGVCSRENILIQTERKRSSGRITLADSGNRVFSVTFRQLQLSDSGKYWCGVDRLGFDTYTAVILTVKEGKCMMFVTITLNKIYLYTSFNFFLLILIKL
uniref:Ig-like domain-containing protein n=1 Tax=Seriola dumerili TaxID=41447 RepID=A0A3B4U020_SERDU